VNLGKSIEDVVEYLCARSFLADFTIRSPKYYKLGGQEKEAADLLIVFKETLIAIQVKSKEVDLSEMVSSIKSKRVTKAIDKATDQFRALGEALNNPNFTAFVNGRGVKIPFEKKKITDFILIVVFVPISKSELETPARIRFNRTCYADAEIPIHLFTLEQFSLLLTLLDTLPDFLLYLTARWTLHREKLIPEDGDPIDEWAFITFERKKLVEILEKQTFVDLSGLMQRYKISIERLERREKPSYFIDQLIETLYGAIGSKTAVDSKFNLLAEANSLESYHLIIPHLAELNRGERAQLTEYLLNRVKNCHKQGIAFRGFKFSEQSDKAYVVLASDRDRNQRRIALSNVARSIGLKLKAKTVVSFAVGNDWPESPVCDVMFVDVSKMKADADLIKFTEEGFSKARIVDKR